MKSFQMSLSLKKLNPQANESACSFELSDFPLSNNDNNGHIFIYYKIQFVFSQVRYGVICRLSGTICLTIAKSVMTDVLI